MSKIKRPFTVCAYAMLFASAVTLTAQKYVFVCFLALLIAACVICAAKRLDFSRHLLIFTVAAVFSATVTSLFYLGANEAFAFAGSDKTVTGIIYSVPTQPDSSYCRIVLNECNINGHDIDGKIKLYTQDFADFRVGDIISLTADTVYVNKQDGVFSFHSLSNKAYLTAISDTLPTYCGHDDKYDIYAFILNIRKNVTDSFGGFLSNENAAVASALITGEQDNLSQKFSSALRVSGTSHIFAVSGMHLSLWTGVFFIIFKRRATGQIIPNTLASIFVVFYCIFTGLSPSVLRSGIMLLCVFSGRIIRKTADTLNSLGIAVCVLLTVNPFLSGNVSFLLSVTATYALTAFAPLLFSQRISVHGKHVFIKEKLMSAKNDFLLSLSVIPITLPVCSAFFGYTSLLSPVTSLVLTPFAEGLMIVGTLAAVCPADVVISNGLAKISELLSNIVIDIIYFFGQLDFTVIPVEKYIVLPWFLISVVVTVICVYLKRTKTQILKTVLICVSCLAFAGVFSSLIHKEETTVYIPQGEDTCVCILSQAQAKAAVYGCTDSYSALRKTVSFLNSKAKLNTDLLIMSSDRYNCEDTMYSLLQPKLTTSLDFEKATDSSYGTLWNNVDIYQLSNGSGCVCAFETDGIKTVIYSYCSTDEYITEEYFCSGDILICEKSLPKHINTDDFSDIIILTNDFVSDLPENAITNEEADITIIVKGGSYVINK